MWYFDKVAIIFDKMYTMQQVLYATQQVFVICILITSAYTTQRHLICILITSLIYYATIFDNKCIYYATSLIYLRNNV